MESFITYRSPNPLPDTAEGTPRDMPVELFSHYLDLVAGSESGPAILGGNEALLHPEFVRLASRAAGKGLPLVVTTTGLPGVDPLLELPGEDLQVILKLYHPDAYPKCDSGVAIRSGRQWMRASDRQLHLRLVVDDCERDYSFVVDLIPELRPASLKIDLASPVRPDEIDPLAEWLSEHMPGIARQRVTVGLDCAFSPCAFSDAEWGKLTKMGINPDPCRPRPGVRPDGMIYHCTSMVEHGAAPLEEFDSEGRAVEFLYNYFSNWQSQTKVHDRCEWCPLLEAGACVGQCLLLKKEGILERIDELQRKDGGQHSISELIQLGEFHLALHRLGEAEEWLTEARGRNPSAGPVHLLLARIFVAQGKKEAAKEEYEKAVRLMPQRPEVRAEAAQRTRNGR